MRIKKHRRLARRTKPFPIGIGIRITGAQNADIIEAGAAHQLTGQLGALLQLALVLAIGADAGDRHQTGEVAHQFSVVSGQPVKDFFHDQGYPLLIEIGY